MARPRPPARWVAAAAVLLVAGFFAAFGLTTALTGDGEGSEAQETPAATPAPAAGATEPVDVETDAPTSDEGPQTSETIDPVNDAVRAPCSVDEIRFLFDRETGTLAVYSGDGVPIASVARDSYRFDGELCRGVPAGIKRYSFANFRANPPVYESGGVSCSVGRGVEVEIHPIIAGYADQQAGNVLLVSVRGRPTILVSGIVVEDLGGRRFSYSSKHCTPL
jgi:hypothetical protein